MQPVLLHKGDTIAIIAPAKSIEKEVVNHAVKIIKENGFKALISPNCIGQHNYFSGTVKERTDDLQWAIDHDEVKAIFCARGGYGSIQLLDRINWVGFLSHPKWMVGFSDVTVFHQHIATMNGCSLHATMPLNFENNTPGALNSLFESLKTGVLHYKWQTKEKNLTGLATGEVIGGNLAVLAGLIGTNEMPDYQNKILFLEEVGEHLYAIDRLFYQLNKVGVFGQIRGLIIGGFTSIKDTEPPFGKGLIELIKSHFTYNNIPIAFDFPAGHIDDNRALILGKEAALKVNLHDATLEY